MHRRAIHFIICLLLGCLPAFSQGNNSYYRGPLDKATNPALVQELDLSYSKLQKLDSGILRYSNISSLKLRGNDILELPAWIAELKQLRSVDLSSNPNFQASSLKYLSGLDIRVLNLSGCNLVYVPEKIGGMANLEELDLGNNLLQQVESFLLQMTSLRALVLHSNFIDSIGDFAGENTSLEWLDISSNPIVNFDDQIKKLDRCVNLKHLGFQGCNKLPSTVARISSLTSLDIRNSSLKDINPAITNLEKLERLTLSNCPNINYTNAFTVIGQIKTLRYLELGYHNPKTTVIPDQIRHLKQLRTLIIDNGMQIDQNSLMLDLARLPELKELRIRGGKYESLSNDVFRLTKLEILDFSDNQCNELPFELNNMKHLREIDIRGNDINADRVENLEEALKGYCYIKSDFNFKSQVLQPGKALVSNGKPAPQRISVDADEGGDYSLGAGVKISVPAGALRLPNGQPASGNVELAFSNLSSPLSFALAGISMNYDSNGYEYLLSSAGMFELHAEQNGLPLKLAAGKTISVTIPGSDPGRRYKVYQYDPDLQTWLERPGESRETGKITVAPPAPLKRPVFTYELRKEKFRITHTKVKNDQTFTFSIINYESPAPTATIEKATAEGHQLYCFELRAFTGTTWIYDGYTAGEDYRKLFLKGQITYGTSFDEQRNQKRNIALTYINDIRLKPNPDGSDNFLMEFYINHELVAAVPVLPLKYANDPASIQKRVTRQYRRYSADLQKRIRLYEKAEADYDKAYAEFEGKMEAYRLFMKAQRRKSIRREGSVQRTLDIAGFGVWNHDITLRMQNMKKIRIDRIVSLQGGVDLKPSEAVIVDLSFYSSFQSDPFMISFDFNSRNIALFPLGNDRIGVLYDEDLKAIASGGPREARLKIIDCKGLSHEEILDRIGI